MHREQGATDKSTEAGKINSSHKPTEPRLPTNPQAKARRNQPLRKRHKEKNCKTSRREESTRQRSWGESGRRLVPERMHVRTCGATSLRCSEKLNLHVHTQEMVCRTGLKRFFRHSSVEDSPAGGTPGQKGPLRNTLEGWGVGTDSRRWQTSRCVTNVRRVQTEGELPTHTGRTHSAVECSLWGPYSSW